MDMMADAFRLTAEDWKGDVPQRIGYQVRGMALSDKVQDLKAVPDMPRKVDADAVARFDPDKGRMSIDDLTVRLGDKLAVQVTAQLTGLDNERMTQALAGRVSLQSPAQDQAAMTEALTKATETIRVESASVRIYNAGLVQALIAAKARTMGVPPALVSVVLQGYAEQALAQRTGPVFKAEAMTAIRAFLADPRTLSLRIAPRPGKGMLVPTALGLAAGLATASDLGATVRANEP